MFGEFKTRERDLRAEKPFSENRRHEDRRRRDAPVWMGMERRARKERRLDADWRFAVIRRAMSPA